jgi:TolB protein
MVRLIGAARTVPGGLCSASPTWSPDGQKITFIKGTTALTRLIVENSDGSRRRILVRTYADHPAWSPDGKRIAFSLYRAGDLGGALSLATIDADGKRLRLRVLTGNPAWNDIPRSWSPSGRWILFERSDAHGETAGGPDLMLIGRDGSGEHAIARNTQQSTGTWKPEPR